MAVVVSRGQKKLVYVAIKSLLLVAVFDGSLAGSMFHASTSLIVRYDQLVS